MSVPDARMFYVFVGYPFNRSGPGGTSGPGKLGRAKIGCESRGSDSHLTHLPGRDLPAATRSDRLLSSSMNYTLRVRLSPH
jgi:hypothetical protein